MQSLRAQGRVGAHPRGRSRPGKLAHVNAGVVPLAQVVGQVVALDADEVLNAAEQSRRSSVQFIREHDQELLVRENVEIPLQDAAVLPPDHIARGQLGACAGSFERILTEEVVHGCVERASVKPEHHELSVTRNRPLDWIAQDCDQTHVGQLIAYTQWDGTLVVALSRLSIGVPHVSRRVMRSHRAPLA